MAHQSRDEWDALQGMQNNPMYKAMYSSLSNKFGKQRRPTGSTVSPISSTPAQTFNYPTSQELWDTAYNLQPFQQQRSILGQMATPQAFQQSFPD